MIDFKRKEHAYFAVYSQSTRSSNFSIVLLNGPDLVLNDILTGSVNNLVDIGDSPSYSKQYIRENLTDLGFTILHTAQFDSNMMVPDKYSYSIRYPFSDRSMTSKFSEAGTATHALMAMHADGFDIDGSCYYFMWGKVGLMGSGADVELSDVNITADTNIFHNDLILKIE